MSMSMKKILLLAKKEVTPGVDSGPTALLNAILCRAVTPKPINSEQVSRDLIRPYKGSSGKLVASVHREFEFEVELAGAGEPGDEPAWGILLEACGFAKTVTADTSVVYKPVSEGEPTLTLWAYLDKVLMKMVASKGTVAFDMNAKAIPVMKFRFIGEYSAMTDAMLPAQVDYTKFVTPLTVGKLNTPSFTMLGIAVCTSGFTIDVANDLIYRDLINCGGPASPDRASTGSATFELTTTAVKDWAESLRDGDQGVVHFEHGREPGNIIELDLPATQATQLTINDQDKIAMVQMSFDINPVLGNDEIVLTVR